MSRTARSPLAGRAAAPGKAGEAASSELDAHCRERIAGYEIPRALCIVEAIERQPSGKPDYPRAKRVAAERAG